MTSSAVHYPVLTLGHTICGLGNMVASQGITMSWNTNSTISLAFFSTSNAFFFHFYITEVLHAINECSYILNFLKHQCFFYFVPGMVIS